MFCTSHFSQLALFCIIAPVFLNPRAASGGEIGFVSHILPAGAQPTGQIGFVLHNWSSRRRLSPIRNPQSEIRNSTRPSPHVSSFRFQITNPRGSASGQTVPLSRGRVARIVPEFCASGTPENRVTPCAARNRKFLSRGVFCLLNCCTNGDSQAAGRQHKQCHPRAGGERYQV